MVALIKTSREWILVTICALIFASNFFPHALEMVYPILDLHGSNLGNMETQKKSYHCGEMVVARMMFQKNRAITGEVKWALVSNSPGSHIDLYSPRQAAAIPGIYDVWIDVEKLPANCTPGQYHFEGVVTYPLLFGKKSYILRTACFEIVK